MIRRRSLRLLVYLSVLSLLIGVGLSGLPRTAMATMAGTTMPMGDAPAKMPMPMAGLCLGGLAPPCCVGSCSYCAHLAGTANGLPERGAPPTADRALPDRRDQVQAAFLPPDPAPPRTSAIA